MRPSHCSLCWTQRHHIVSDANQSIWLPHKTVCKQLCCPLKRIMPLMNLESLSFSSVLASKPQQIPSQALTDMLKNASRKLKRIGVRQLHMSCWTEEMTFPPLSFPEQALFARFSAKVAHSRNQTLALRLSSQFTREDMMAKQSKPERKD